MRGLLLAVLLLAVLFFACFNATALPMTDFRLTPVVQDGRIKPLDSMARALLQRLSGAESLEGRDAATWLAGWLFAPEAAARVPSFRVHSATLLKALGLPSAPARAPARAPAQASDALFSFAELAPALTAKLQNVMPLLQRSKRQLTPDEREWVQLYVNFRDMEQLGGSFSLLAPLPRWSEALSEHFHLPKTSVPSYEETLKFRPRLAQDVAAIARRRGSALNAYSPLEQELTLLSYMLASMEAQGQRNWSLRVMPPAWEGEKDWLSPWMLLESGRGSPAGEAAFHEWRRALIAWQQNDAEAWRAAMAALRKAGSTAPGVRESALWVEWLYHLLAPLSLALSAYFIALALTLGGAMFAGNMRIRALRFARLALGVGVLAHSAALLARIMILARPPVGNLYESLLFVALIAAAAGWALARRLRAAPEPVLGGAVLASLLLLAAREFGGDGDTLEVLTAVLNTQFWLATHVICITLGYGAALLSGIAAQCYLAKRLYAAENTAAFGKMLPLMALAALLFTATGTMLGGIWADRSWGRFWGWDPKENGALLIVLWLIWLIHARLCGQFQMLGFAIGLSCITMIVAVAWIGVNLLGVGLHSYGFSDAEAGGFIAFLVVQGLVILGLAGTIFVQERRRHG